MRCFDIITWLSLICDFPLTLTLAQTDELSFDHFLVLTLLLLRWSKSSEEALLCYASKKVVHITTLWKNMLPPEIQNPPQPLLLVHPSFFQKGDRRGSVKWRKAVSPFRESACSIP